MKLVREVLPPCERATLADLERIERDLRSARDRTVMVRIAGIAITTSVGLAFVEIIRLL